MADQVYTLVEAAKAEPESRSTGYIGLFAESYQPFWVAPVQPSDREYPWSVEKTVAYTGSTGSRLIGSDFDATQGQFANYVSEVKAYGGKIKVDEYIADNMPMTMPRQRQSQVTSYARKMFIDTFEGAGGANLRGVRDWLGGDLPLATTKIAAGYETQVIRAGTTAHGDLLTMDMLDELISVVSFIPGMSFLYMNSILARRIKKLTRGTTAGDYRVDYRPEEVGRFDFIYSGWPIVVARDADNATLLSTAEQDSANANATTMSVYAVCWGVDMATYHSTSPTGIAKTPIPQVSPMGDGSNYKYERFTLYPGFAPQKKTCIGRLCYVKNALA
jgi:hypothetical protein